MFLGGNPCNISKFGKKSEKTFIRTLSNYFLCANGLQGRGNVFLEKKVRKNGFLYKNSIRPKKNTLSWIVSFLKTRISDTRFRLKCLPYGVFIGTIWALGLSVRIFLKNWYFGQVIAKIIVYPSLPQSKAIQRSKFVCEFLLKNNADFTPKQFLKITLSTDLLSIFLETYILRLSELSLVAFSFKPTHTLAYGVCGGLGVGVLFLLPF